MRYRLESIALYLVAIAIGVTVILRITVWAQNELIQIGTNL